MDLQQAQNILQKTFGNVKQIEPGNVVLLDDRAAIWTSYDDVCIRNGVKIKDPVTGVQRPWQAGDAQARFPHGLNGFADNNTVYVNKQTSSPTTTAHEMMHNNAAPDFRGAVGETLNEGTTQYLTIKALKAEGIQLPDRLPYPDETRLVEALSGTVGEDAVTRAYFGGGKALAEALDALGGPDTFNKFRALADAKDYDGAIKLLQNAKGGTTKPGP